MRIVRRPEFGAFVATLLVYVFFAVTTPGAGFVGDRRHRRLAEHRRRTRHHRDSGRHPDGRGRIRPFGRRHRRRLVDHRRDRDDPVRPADLADDRRSRWCMGLASACSTASSSVRTGLPSFIVTLATSFSVGGLSLGLARLLSEHHDRIGQGAAAGRSGLRLGLGPGQRLDPVVDRRDDPRRAGSWRAPRSATGSSPPAAIRSPRAAPACRPIWSRSSCSWRPASARRWSASSRASNITPATPPPALATSSRRRSSRSSAASCSAAATARRSASSSAR